MRYLACPQGTADWVLGKPALLDSLNSLTADPELTAPLSGCDFVEGPLRVTADEQHKMIAFWNVDYISGTGDEPWGFVKMRGKHSLELDRAISRQVLERCIYVINQRLQGLLIEGAYIHRSWANGAHTCLAGRGSQARHVSIGYFERVVEGAGAARAITCVGPEYDLTDLSKAAAESGRELEALVIAANTLIGPGRKKPACPDGSLPALRRSVSAYITVGGVGEYSSVEVATEPSAIPHRRTGRGAGLQYAGWLESGSPLSEVQRRIIESDAIEKHPLRITGPGGSGKTLLMQLLALRVLESAHASGRPARVMYVVHNVAMARMVQDRFAVLDPAPTLRDSARVLEVSTLAEYARGQLGLEFTSVIDPDAHEAKAFQLNQIEDAVRATMAAKPAAVAASKLFSVINDNPDLMLVLARLVSTEISIAIKGHGLESDRRRYIQIERPLSRLHGLMSPDERSLVFDIYEKYRAEVFEGLGVLDTDDIALSLLGRLRTPIWELMRRDIGYDFVFVDETQLFNENERRVLPLLTKPRAAHVPIVLALDEAQDVYAQATAGLATLGIRDIANENLASIHRSTRSIVKLAFYIIQRSTDLFGPDFPDFTGIAEHMEQDTHPLAAPPRIEATPESGRGFGRFVVKRLRELRRDSMRRIAVICHADAYWDLLLSELKESDLPLHVAQQRGERLPAQEAQIVLTRPLLAGGQEFDAVVLVGLEQGVTPARVVGNDALAAAVEQQALREMYLAVTRARYRVVVVLAPGAAPNETIGGAERVGLITRTRP